MTFTTDSENDNLIYAGFWIRLIAGIIDYIICLPFTYTIKYIDGYNKFSFCWGILINIILLVIYDIYFVKKYGGTLGKLIVKIKILKTNGEKVDWKESFLRSTIPLTTNILTFVLMLMSVQNITDKEFFAINYKNRGAFILTESPYFYSLLAFIFIAIIGEYVVLLTNKKRRAIHDYIAGTIVINTK